MKTLFVSALALSTSLAASAHAQSVTLGKDPAAKLSSGSEGEGSGEVILEEIVVTGDKKFGASTIQVGSFRNARIIDVPLTVNVVAEGLMKAQDVESTGCVRPF